MRAVVIPCRNHAGSIGRLVQLCRRYAPLVIVADDSSTDGSPCFAGAAGAHVVEVNPDTRTGLASVYVAGLRTALDMGATTVVELDAGGSHNPEQLGRFYVALEGNVADVVAGRRFGFCASHRGSLKRYALSLLGTLLTNIVHGTRYADATSGYIGYTRLALESLLSTPYKSTGHYYQTEMRLRARTLGLELVEMPIDYRCKPSSSLRWASILEALKLVFAR